MLSYMDNTVPAGVVTFMSNVVDEIINPIIAVLFALALVYFMYGLATFMLQAGNQSAREAGKRHLLNALIGMTVMVSVFAIINMVLATFGVNGTDLPDQIVL